MAPSANPVYGNYHGYYSKRPSVRDSRLALLPTDFFVGKTVLDVGCNEGLVTCEIGQSWGPRQVVGVDIDDTLIRAAWKRRRSLWSLQAPTVKARERTHDVSTSSPPLKRVQLAQDYDSGATHYFPASCEHVFGPLPISASGTGESQFPHNVTFRTTDWVTEDVAADEGKYDCVLAFSITKWIHLNHGDNGIKCFFRKIHKSLKPGGVLVLEPQSWDTYAKARRMDQRLRENAKHLQLRPQDFSSLLQELGFGPPQHLGSTGEGGFHRPVDLHFKI
ncbi:Bicoid-interacting protein 3-domain-containing protein [Phlebopus sp. FC_14]|nr:Bicoid-interacting protein 3-domain-containing protein [Phlebopus sp. FC_14]